MSEHTPPARDGGLPGPRQADAGRSAQRPEHAEPAEPPELPEPAQATAGESAQLWKSRAELAVERGLLKVTGRVLGPYQSAVVRIGFAATWLFFLLREWPHRDELYGPGSPWGLDLARQLIATNDAFTVLAWTDSVAWFEIVYAFSILASGALMLGWHTRASAVFFMIGVLSLQNRSVFMGDGGDNIIHLMAIYLVLTRCGHVWSLDVRRRRRARERAHREGRDGEGTDVGGVVLWVLSGLALFAVALGPGFSAGWSVIYAGLWMAYGVWWAVGRLAPGEPRTVLDILGNLVHNGALFVIMFEVCLVYATAGWYKIQGSRWQDGTAVYYPLKLDYFAPWPELNEVLAGGGLAIMAMTYGTVLVQVAFPFTLFNRKAKNVLLALMIGEHLSIAVLLGLPFFSMAMIAADMVFLPTALLVWFGAGCAGLRARLARRGGPDDDGIRSTGGAADPASAPSVQAQAPPADRSPEHVPR